MKKLTGIVTLISFLFITNCFAVKVEVANPADENRSCETISLELKTLSGFENVKPAVYSENLKKFIPYQLIDNDGDGANDELIFQADFDAKQTQGFEIVEANENNQVQLEYGATAQFVPHRKDDFAWENDKIAFRMYGQELQRTEMISSGIDVWVKKVDYPVMKKLYDMGKYHADNPMGIDFYNVGPTLGCGGLGVWHEDKLLLSENFCEWKIIANGPIRTVFELTYKPWEMGGGKKIGEVKRFSLDKGSNFNRIESKFDWDVKDIAFAAGIVKCERGGKATYAKENNFLGYWQNPHQKFGVIGCAVILPKEAAGNKAVENEKNYMLLAKAKNNSVVYYAGAGWDKTAGFETEEKWNAFIEKTAKLIENPLKIEVE